MKKITVILQEKNVKLNSLPENIQTAIENSINLYDDIQNLEATLTEESTDEERAELVEMRETHDEFNESIVGAIENFQKETEVKKKAEQKNDEPPTPPPAPKNTPAPIGETDEKKKGFGIGTFILGAAVLIATAGAVNMMRNKN
jgi:predicted  nucleic acid-binding Zn-ribbon protein